MYTRRSTRIRQPPITFSPSTRHSTTIARNIRTNTPSTTQITAPYALNRGKAIKKKAKATDRPEACRVEPKKGGNIVIHLSTAAYEVVKGAMLQHFGRRSETTDIKSKVDQNQAVVEHIITAYKDKAKANKGKLYTINLYHTQSKILTNGQHPNICIDHIMKIFTEINQDEIDHLNNLIREKCSEAGQKSPGSQTTTQSAAALSLMPPSPPGARASISNSILQESIEDRDSEIDSINTVVCPYCNSPAQNESIECSKCSQWIHIECEGLNNDEAKEYEEDLNKTFTCNLCQTLNQEQAEMNNSHTITTNAATRTTTPSRVGNSHLQALQSTPTQAHTQHNQDNTWLKQPATTESVGNSHYLNVNPQNHHTCQKTPWQDQANHSIDTTYEKQPATHSTVGNPHLHNSDPQNYQTCQKTQMQEQANHTLDTTYEKQTVALSAVGNSHLIHNSNSQNYQTYQKAQMKEHANHTSDSTHEKQIATHSSTVGNPHLHNSNAQSQHMALSARQRSDSTHTTAKRTVGNSHVPQNCQEALTEKQSRHITDNTATTAVGNSHSQSTNSSQIVPAQIPHKTKNQKQKITTQTRAKDMLHNTNPKLPYENTSPNNPEPINSTQITIPGPITATASDPKNTKKKPKKQDFQLTDVEKQLAFCKAEVIRLENCCKEYQNTIQILKLKLATTIPEHDTTTQNQTYQERQTATDRTIDIRIASLEAQMSILKEKVELQQAIHELKEERRQIHPPYNHEPKTSRNSGCKTNTDTTENDLMTGTTTTTPMGTTKQMSSQVHFLSHGRASTSTYRNLKPRSTLDVTRVIGQPLFMQQNCLSTNASQTQNPQAPITHIPQTTLTHYPTAKSVHIPHIPQTTLTYHPTAQTAHIPHIPQTTLTHHPTAQTAQTAHIPHIPQTTLTHHPTAQTAHIPHIPQTTLTHHPTAHSSQIAHAPQTTLTQHPTAHIPHIPQTTTLTHNQTALTAQIAHAPQTTLTHHPTAQTAQIAHAPQTTLTHHPTAQTAQNAHIPQTTTLTHNQTVQIAQNHHITQATTLTHLQTAQNYHIPQTKALTQSTQIKHMPQTTALAHHPTALTAQNQHIQQATTPTHNPLAQTAQMQNTEQTTRIILPKPQVQAVLPQPEPLAQQKFNIPNKQRSAGSQWQA